MSTLSIPINQELEDFIDGMIKENRAENKAELVRRALYKFKEDQLLSEILEAEQNIKDGQVYTGDLDKLAKAFK